MAADVAWRQICEAEITDYAQSDSEYLAAWVDNLRDIRDRVLRIFSGKAASDGKDLPHGGIVFAQSMTPSTFLAFDWTRLAGAALRGGRYINPQPDELLLLLCNGLGGTPLIELYVLYHTAEKALAKRGLNGVTDPGAEAIARMFETLV